MLLNLSSVLVAPGASLPFSASLDLSDLTFGSGRPVTQPVLASGAVRNTAGVLEMTGTVSTTLHAVCDRCASEFERSVSWPIRATLVTEPDADSFDDLWTFEIRDGCADLDDIVTTTFVLNMDSRLLCREDCRGLCCRCGKNLNEGPCGCGREPDPRFAALKQLLEQE